MFSPQSAASLLMLALPLLYLVSALLLLWRHAPTTRRLARYGVGLAMVSGVVAMVLVLAVGHDGHASGWLSPAPVSAVMLALVCFIGAIIHRYSERYLDGEPRRQRYDVALLLTLASVATVLVSDHLLVILLGWTAISLCLHGLLRFYPDRPRAALAAHKKFLFARLAEACLLAAFVILRVEHGTWSASAIIAAYPLADMNLAAHVAAFLIASAAMIKCAQLPMHGWLMQVVEAPTPVSALLHAGVVNLGGYLLILFGPVWLQSALAQWVVLLVAGATVVLAALSMAIRVSVKVKLAWSTCAQMALMLIECALGLFELALLHLVAHSCYKAHAFLNAGSAAQTWRATQLAPAAAPGMLAWVASAGASALLVGIAAIASGHALPVSPWLFLAAALTVILAEQGSRRVVSDIRFFAPFAIGMVLAYSLLKLGAGQLLAGTTMTTPIAADLWVSVLVLALFTGHLMLRHAPESPRARQLARTLYAGLYLDEWATRTTLAIWPVQLPAGQHAAAETTANLKVSSS